MRKELIDSHISIAKCEAMFGKKKGNNGFRYDNCVEPSLVARVEELYVVVYQKSNITNNTIGVSFARVVLIERKGKFKVNLAHFVAEVKGIEARGHKGKVVVKSLGRKMGCATTIFVQHTSPINLDHQL
jgi:hypothetical protein